jgi:hypothetical protein
MGCQEKVKVYVQENRVARDIGIAYGFLRDKQKIILQSDDSFDW